MQKIIVAALFLASAAPAFAQEPQPYQFKDNFSIKATPVKNQEQTGTCWAFSCASFLESEALRAGKVKGEINLSEMFVVRHIYHQKCENYVRRQGHAQFGEGGLAHDYINAVAQYGIVPEDIYPGRRDPLKPFNHGNLVKKLKKMCDDFASQGEKGELPADWIKQIDNVLDEEFGPVPQKFSIENRPFTPVQYRDYLGLDMNNYVSITSFTHHPFYKPFILEVPDNFANGQFYNLPIDDMMRCINYALQRNYSVEWDADVSNDNFSAKNGLAIVPKLSWKEKTAAQREQTFKSYEAQRLVSQEYRQELFDRQETMDDHLMHITGVRTESNHTDIYYIVKNSWGEISDLKGYLNVSEQYMRLNTISILINKNAMPTEIAQRLGLTSGEVRIPTQEMKKAQTSADESKAQKKAGTTLTPAQPTQRPKKEKKD